jgi:hypothetical protein
MWNFLLRKSQRILAVPLPPQTEGLKTLKEQESAKGVQAWAQVPEKLCAHFDCKCNFAKGLGEDEPVIPLGRVGEAREFSRLGPVEFALIKKER